MSVGNPPKGSSYGRIAHFLYICYRLGLFSYSAGVKATELAYDRLYGGLNASA